MNQEHPIVVTAHDLERLQRLVDQNLHGRNANLAELLEQELVRAEVREQLPPGVVGMNSTVLFEDVETATRREVTLCYPHEVDASGQRVSVLAPIGSALLGLSVGQSIDWHVPGGRRRVRIVAVTQPQAAPAPQPAQEA